MYDRRERLRAWAAHGRSLGLAAVEKFNRAMKNWRGDVANCFVARSSNSPTEGFNRGLGAVLSRRAG